MGLDGVELVLAVEEKFEIAISDEEAVKIKTPRMLIDFIYSQLNDGPSRNASCLSQITFHRIRRALIDMTGLPRKSISPSLALQDLLPEDKRREHWAELRKALNVSGYPMLARPPWLRRVLWYFHLILFLSLVFYFSWLKPHSGSFYISIAITGLMAIIMFRATSGYAIYFEPAGYTVGDLSRVSVANIPEGASPKTWNRDEVAAITRAIIMKQLGIADFRDDDRFVEDLGVD